MNDFDQRLRGLPDPLAELLREAVSISAEYTGVYDESQERREYEAWDRAMNAAGFHPSSGWKRRPIPLADELEPTQRKVLEALAFTPGLPLNGWPTFAAAWLRRRWLGLEDGGELFASVDLGGVRLPMVFALRRLIADKLRDEALDRIADVPIGRRLDLLVDLSLAPLDIEIQLGEVVGDTTAELGDIRDPTLAGVARRLADRLLAAYAEPHRPGERPTGDVDDGLAMMAFTALVAAGQPIEPQHDSLLRLSWGEFAAASLNTIASIPEARREAALHAGLDAIRFPNHRLLAAQAVLPVHPYPSLLRRVLDEIDRTQDPSKALIGLTEIAKHHPTLAPLLATDPEVERIDDAANKLAAKKPAAKKPAAKKPAAKKPAAKKATKRG